MKNQSKPSTTLLKSKKIQQNNFDIESKKINQIHGIRKLIIFYMDSIFQIKINENKLQKIITELTSNQNNIFQQLSISKQLINEQASVQLSIKKQLNLKFEELDRKLNVGIKQLNQQLLIQFQRLQNCIATSSESHMEKIGRIDQIIAVNAQEFSLYKSQFVEKLAKLNEDIERKLSLKNIEEKTEEDIQKKVENMQKMFSKIAQTAQLFHNKNFLYFLQSLVDKEQGSSRLVPETFKQLKNPLQHQSSQQKAKRFNDIRKKLEQTHTKIQSMQSEYTNYFFSATQGNKQNREETHLHYALLSTKIKELDQKLGAVKIQNVCVQKVLYPSQKQRKVNSKTRIQCQGNNSATQGGLKKQQIAAMIKDELQATKNTLQQISNELKQKVETIQHQIWSSTKKHNNLKSTITNLKTDFQKHTQKLKLGHFNQYFTQRDQFVPKASGLINQFRYIQDQIQTKLNNKVDSIQFNKIVQQDNEKFKIINEQIDEKANKQETRKAFNFFQEKIREIVTILAGMQNFSRKTAGKKLMMQCLSCDQNFLEEVIVSNQQSHPTTPRNLTSRVGSSLKIKRNDNLVDKNTRKSNI